MTLAVFRDGTDPYVARSAAKDREVDSLDLARLRNNRPSAAGRAAAPVAGRAAWSVPAGAIVEASRPATVFRGGSPVQGGRGLGTRARPTQKGWPGRPSA
ncbi:MAG: hypothetical protein U0835_03595 [Isosphaeraceae bacterium]